MGMRRPVPKARRVTLSTGAAGRRLNSALGGLAYTASGITRPSWSRRRASA